MATTREVWVEIKPKPTSFFLTVGVLLARALHAPTMHDLGSSAPPSAPPSVAPVVVHLAAASAAPAGAP